MPEARVLAIFVKAPIPGRVKTRLAADMGPVQATALYRRLGRQVVKAVASEGYETVVWHAPRHDGPLVRAWLGGLGVSRFLPQLGGDLGNRLRAAFAKHFRESAHHVVIIGSDCPGVDRGLIARAFAALGDHDLVLGPAWDGGYYLIGMTTLHVSLFQGISWSSSVVARETEDRARAAGLSCHSLPPLRDVDTLADAHAVGRAARRQAASPTYATGKGIRAPRGRLD